jgi:hypothetical protein
MTKTTAPLAMACLAATIAAAGLDAAALGGAEAQVITYERPRAGPPKSDVVVAHSRWGHGSVSGPVRRAPNGWEVRLPRGTWIPCKRSCSEELRFATVDFWETQGRSAPDGGPGYFRFNFWF